MKMFGASVVEIGKTKSSIVENQLIELLESTQSRDRTGMEVNPLVFETSASTNSAIWAFSGCKSKLNFGTDKDFLPFTEIILQ